MVILSIPFAGRKAKKCTRGMLGLCIIVHVVTSIFSFHVYETINLFGNKIIDYCNFKEVEFGNGKKAFGLIIC